MTDTNPAPLSDDERAELDKLRAAQAAQAVPYTEAAAARGQRTHKARAQK